MISEADKHSVAALSSNLAELRNRLLRVLGVILFSTLCMIPFSQDIYNIVAGPLLKYLPDGGHMIATEVTSTFMAPLKLVVYTASALSMPVLLFQLWAFISPRLYQSNRNIGISLLFLSVFLFYLGIAFSFYVVLPLVFSFFSGATPAGVSYPPDISLYLSAILKLFLAFGLTFEIPIATVVLIMSGITTRKSLSEKRPYIIVGCFVIGMFLTPPDLMSQALLAVPMIMLFEIGLLISFFLVREPLETTE